MRKQIIKFIVCFCLITCLMIGYCTAFASAEPAWLIRAKAGIMAAMFAANLSLEQYNVVHDYTITRAIDPLGIVTTVAETNWDAYIDKSAIVVRPDSVTIDGVQYSDIWIGPDATDNLRLAGFDFVSAYNILSNQSSAITYASGEGYVDDLPIYEVNGHLRSQAFSIIYGPYQNPITTRLGPFYCYFMYNQQETGGRGTANLTGTTPVSYQNISIANDIYYLYNTNSNIFRPVIGNSGTGTHANLGADTTTAFVEDPFTFDYTSGLLDSDPLDPDLGLHLRIPSEYNNSDPTYEYNYDIHDLINIYPQVTDDHGTTLNMDPTLNPDFQVDIDLGNELGDLITAILIAKLAGLLDDFDIEIDYTEEPENPEPTPVDPDTPDPDIPIGDQDPIWLDELMRWIKSAIDNLGNIIHQDIQNIREDLQDLIYYISEIPELILSEIELGPAKLIQKALDILQTLFMPLLLPIQAMMGLWHYVVEWIQSIITPFTWIFGVMSGTSGNMVLPIYATLSGGICIAIYKALGR